MQEVAADGCRVLGDRPGSTADWLQLAKCFGNRRLLATGSYTDSGRHAGGLILFPVYVRAIYAFTHAHTHTDSRSLCLLAANEQGGLLKTPVDDGKNGINGTGSYRPVL